MERYFRLVKIERNTWHVAIKTQTTEGKIVKMPLTLFYRMNHNRYKYLLTISENDMKYTSLTFNRNTNYKYR